MVENDSSCVAVVVVVVVAASVVVSVEELQLRIFFVILPNFFSMPPCLPWVHCQALDIILENLTKFQLILIGPTERGWSWKESKSWCDLHGLIKNFVKKSQLTGATACYFKLVSLRIRTENSRHNVLVTSFCSVVPLEDTEHYCRGHIWSVFKYFVLCSLRNIFIPNWTIPSQSSIPSVRSLNISVSFSGCQNFTRNCSGKRNF